MSASQVYYALYVSALRGLASAAQPSASDAAVAVVGDGTLAAPWFPWATILLGLLPRWIDLLNCRDRARASADGATAAELEVLETSQVRAPPRPSTHPHTHPHTHAHTHTQKKSSCAQPKH